MRVFVSSTGLTSALLLSTSSVVDARPPAGQYGSHHHLHQGSQGPRPFPSTSALYQHYPHDRAVNHHVQVSNAVPASFILAARTAGAEPAPTAAIGFEKQTRSTTGKMQNIAYANSFSAPSVANIKLLGSASQSPEKRVITHTNANVPNMAPYLLSSASSTLTTDFGIWNGSGTLTLTDKSETSALTKSPWFSRDNGKGGYLNGKKLFLYADTETRIPAEGWSFGGFVSSSVAVDVGNQAKFDKAPVLQDPTGSFENAQGTLRGFIPSTLGEAGYTDAMVSQGQRIAIWPQSSLIYFDSETALVYADVVHVDAKSDNRYTGLGNTLLKVTIPSNGGPQAHRIVPIMFTHDDLPFGTVGGIRAWGAQGPGGSDGYVYLFAAGEWGLFLARVYPDYLELKAAYEYYDAASKTWSYHQPARSSSSYFLPGQISVVDIFYSPRHLTFIAVYQNIYIDNTVYFRFLESGGIKPAYAGGTSSDVVADMLHSKWSDERVLVHLPRPENGEYAYAAGVSMGYFDNDDIVNGGTKMLVQWCEPLPQSNGKGYNTDFAVVEFE